MIQTCLEKRGIQARHRLLAKSEYHKDNQYSAEHKNALSDGDIKGKGTGDMGHIYKRSVHYGFQEPFLYTIPTDVVAGNSTDVEMRERSRAANFYSARTPYPYADENGNVRLPETVYPGQYSINMRNRKPPLTLEDAVAENVVGNMLSGIKNTWKEILS